MKKYFDADRQRLEFHQQSATPDFWTKRWQHTDLKTVIEKDSRYPVYVAMTRRFLPAPAKILEGGCGQGSVVLALQRAGYDAYGIDYAHETIAAVHALYPELNLTVGDVTHVPFPDHFFDGYWSLGVIEHYRNGFLPLLNEMERILKPGGFLFLTFPYMSPLRRMKSALRLYPPVATAPHHTDFYQFALNHQEVIREYQRHNFKLRYQQSLDGMKGLQEEIAGVRRTYTALGRYLPLVHRLAAAGATLLTPISGHIRLCVFQYQPPTPL